MPQTDPSPSVGSLDETLASHGGSHGVIGEASFERGDVVGRYVVLEDIGRGAMGLVVAAYDPELDRKIALKLVRVGPGAAESSSGARARLIREAQAMAKLAHPNVITIHDVGAAGDDVFIAMEFVDGGSLREYLAREKPSWQAIVATFIQAGEGLAAAHAQGIVHRDFKPDNVLVRSDGRVGVADFGLARRDDSHAEETSPADVLEQITSTLRDTSIDTLGGLTMTGATLGTPAYMAPEQHLRTSLDHRCDQFAFCVALWEALVGRRPYAGTTLGAIALSVTSGKLEEFPRDSPVPSRIRTALERGLRRDPDERFASMHPLLDELRTALRAEQRRDSKRPWRWVLGGATLLAIAALVHVANEHAAEPPQPCTGASEHMVGVWDDQTEAEARAAFERSGRSFAAHSFARADATLDGLRDQWVASHTAACEATRVHGEQSEDMLDRRMSCLARRRGELAAVATALRAGDEATVEGVDALLATIEPIADCDDLEQLRTELAPPPADRRAAVDDLRDRLADLQIRQRTLSNIDATAEVATLLAEAEALDYAPIVAEVLNIQTSVVEATEGPQASRPIARRAMAVAAEANHRRALVEALITLGWIEGVGRADYDLGLWLLDQARAETHALGDPVRTSLQIRSNRGAVHFQLGDYEAAMREFEAALEFAREKLGDDHIRVADLRFNIGGVHQQLGHAELAEQAFRLAVTHYTELMGPDHPEVAQCHGNLAISLMSLGKFAEAEQQVRRAIAILEADGGHSSLGGNYATLGEIALRRDDLPAALASFERAYALKAEVFGADNPSTQMTLASLAKVEHLLGRHDDARAHFLGGIESGVASSPYHAMVVELRIGLADVELSAGDYSAAIAQLDEVDARLALATEESSWYIAEAKRVRARLEHLRGNDRAARALLDQAEALLTDADDPALVQRIAALRAELDG
jgi:tRNA A-37 threonylcarbamoyl transferase component Bud32/tetratricopeptide (TPR) repeat protein